jgi:hypothetical protein
VDALDKTLPECFALPNLAAIGWSDLNDRFCLNATFRVYANLGGLSKNWTLTNIIAGNLGGFGGVDLLGLGVALEANFLAGFELWSNAAPLQFYMNWILYDRSFPSLINLNQS